MSAPARGTLLLRLAGPMQSWGTQSRFTVRDTGLEPSKSGIVGLLCAALGRPRAAPVDDLAALRLGVRVDREGRLAVDYHTALDVATIDGKPARTVESRRSYLADADFLAGLEGDLTLLARLHAALAAPRWQLCLGRKAFVPGLPVWIPAGLRPGAALREALAAEPWPAPGRRVPSPDRRPHRLRLVLEAVAATAGEARRDQPVGATFRDRRFAVRYLETAFLTLGTDVPLREA